MRFLSAAVLLTGLVLASLSWGTFRSHQITQQAMQENLQLQELRGSIIHLDEVLTMSVRMAAVTGDLKWEERYRLYEPQLGRAIKEAGRLVPEASGVGATDATDAANIKLVNMENRAFELVRQGRSVEAESLLFSDEYEDQKRIYAKGMNRLASVLTASSQDIMKKEQRRAYWSITFAIGATVILLIGWILVLRTTFDWRAALLASHDQLEARVEQRTKELKASEKAAAIANRAKSDFLASMSHEIRTPMNAIIGLTDLVLDSELESTQREYLKLVDESAHSLLTIINDILDFSKIEAGKLDLEEVVFDLRERVGDVMKSLALRAHDRKLELAWQIDPGTPDALLGDPTRLGQVIVNLVGNAVKFTETGEVVLKVECESRDDHEAMLRFSIRDTGIGIPAEKLERIFEAFTQADASTTRKHGGTGLGLAITSRLVGMMGGRIWVESELGSGSTFYFTARFRIASSQPKRTLVLDAPNGRGSRVLIVDDNATNRLILEEMVRNWGMQPTAVEGAQQAIDTLRQSIQDGDTFPLVLSDVNMPEVDGLTLTQWIRQDQNLKDTTVIMLTSGIRPDDLRRCEQLQVAAQLMKPVKPSELLNVIASALETAVPETDQQPAAATKHLPVLPPLHVLLAEDGLANQTLAVALLKKHGHTVVVAKDGKETIRTLASAHFDVVLMDVEMPEMDGLEATAVIRTKETQTGQHIPIIAMTAHAMSGDRERCLAAGMDEYISKPVRPKILFETIAKVLGIAEP